MIGLLDIDGIRVVLDGVTYEAEEIAMGPDFDVVWPPKAPSAIDSIGLTMPTGFVVNNSPLTEGGSIDVEFDPLYSLPTIAAQELWNETASVFQILKSGNTITGVKSLYDFYVQGNIAATGNVAAGEAGIDSGLTNYILYRLDDWDAYNSGSGSGNTEYWVPAAKIVKSKFSWVYDQIDLLWTAVQNAGSGSGGGGTSQIYGLVATTPSISISNSPSSPTIQIGVGVASGYKIPSLQELEPLSLFSPIKNNNVIVGALANYDISIIQDEGSTSGSGDDTLKNISEILRHESIVDSDPDYLLFDMPIVSTGNVAAGAVGGDSGLTNEILYRLDSWDAYSSSTEDWVPSAEIINDRFLALENASSSDLKIVNWVDDVANVSVGLNVDGRTEYLSLKGSCLLKSDFEAIFDVQTDSVSLLPVSNQTVRNFNVPGDIIASGNVAAGSIGIDAGLTNYLLYRLDDWDEYNNDKAGWVPSAALVNAIRLAIATGGYDDTDLWNAISDIQDVNTDQNNDIQQLQARPQIIYVGAGTSQADYPAYADMVENALYVKLVTQ